MLDTLTSDDFVPRIDETFETALDGAPVALKLVSVDVMDERYSRPGARLSFSLMFEGPMTPVLPQGTYAFANETMGTLALFAVPLGPDGDGVSYQVVFN